MLQVFTLIFQVGKPRPKGRDVCNSWKVAVLGPPYMGPNLYAVFYAEQSLDILNETVSGVGRGGLWEMTSHTGSELGLGP